ECKPLVGDASIIPNQARRGGRGGLSVAAGPLNLAVAGRLGSEHGDRLLGTPIHHHMSVRGRARIAGRSLVNILRYGLSPRLAGQPWLAVKPHPTDEPLPIADPGQSVGTIERQSIHPLGRNTRCDGAQTTPYSPQVGLCFPIAAPLRSSLSP